MDVVLILDQSSSLITGQPNYDNWNRRMLGFASMIIQVQCCVVFKIQVFTKYYFKYISSIVFCTCILSAFPL